MTDLIAISPEQFIFSQGNELKTTSLKIADAFSKKHGDVLRSIDNVLTQVSDSFGKRNFAPAEYEQKNNLGILTTYRSYVLTKDGFMFLVMSFTGKKASAIKESYINAFNAMYEKVFNRSQIPQEKPTLQSKKGCLTKDQQDIIKNIVRSTVEVLPKDQRAKVTIGMWSAIKSKFGKSYKEVSESEFDNIISLLARLPIEGELLQKQAEPKDNITLDDLIKNCKNPTELEAMLYRSYKEPCGIRVFMSVENGVPTYIKQMQLGEVILHVEKLDPLFNACQELEQDEKIRLCQAAYQQAKKQKTDNH